MFQFSAAGILVVLAIVSFQVHAQGLRAYTTGEINIEPKKYLGSDKPVAGQARYLHNIPDLIKLTNPGLEGTGVVVAVWDGGTSSSGASSGLPARPSRPTGIRRVRICS